MTTIKNNKADVTNNDYDCRFSGGAFPFGPGEFTTTERDEIPSDQLRKGLIIYNSTTDRIQFWQGSAWESVDIDT